MIIFQIGYFWNFYSFSNKNLLIMEIVKFENWLIYKKFLIENLENFANFTVWKINKFSEFF